MEAVTSVPERVIAPSIVRAIRRILRRQGATPCREVRRELVRLGYMTKGPADGWKLADTIRGMLARGEIEISAGLIHPLVLGKTQPPYNRLLMPQIRKMLRARPVMSRSEMREDLRARGHIGKCRHGGRRLYHALHDMADRGEVELTPDTVTAIALLPPRSYAQPKLLRPLTTKRQAARDRARKVVERALPPPRSRNRKQLHSCGPADGGAL